MKSILEALVDDLNGLSCELNIEHDVNRKYVLVESPRIFIIYISQSKQEEDFYYTMENKKHLILRKAKINAVETMLGKTFAKHNVDSFSSGDLGYKIEK